MKGIRGPIVLALALAVAGCEPPPGTSRKQPATVPARQLALAATFLRSGDLPRAMHLYGMVASANPGTPSGTTAARMLGFLHASPRSPARNDSLAAVWFRTTLAWTHADEDRIQAETGLILLERATSRSVETRRQRAMVDSLQRTIRRQAGTIMAQTRRLMDMEREVVRARAQLKRQKESDGEPTRSRGTP